MWPVPYEGTISYGRGTADGPRARDIVGRTDWYEKAVSHLTKNVYLTIDIDALDPSLVPSTGAPEPGGLGWYDVIGIVCATARARNILGMDVTELAPVAGNSAPDFLAAKLVYKCLSYIFEKEITKSRSTIRSNP